MLEGLLKEMEELNWKGWGNPFTVEITRENAAEMGVPDYFAICKKSRSLVRWRALACAGGREKQREEERRRGQDARKSRRLALH